MSKILIAFTLILSGFSVQAQTEENLVRLYQREFAQLTGEEIALMNAQEMESLTSTTANRIDENGRIGWITESEANSVAKWLHEHPVAGLEMLPHYDPTGATGFCFGRAMASHLELLARGVAKDAIRKAYITP